MHREQWIDILFVRFLFGQYTEYKFLEKAKETIIKDQTKSQFEEFLLEAFPEGAGSESLLFTTCHAFAASVSHYTHSNISVFTGRTSIP